MQDSAESVEETQQLLDQYSERLPQMLDWLSQFGRDPEGGVTRLLYSDAWLEAQQALSHWMEQEGLEASFDQTGNLAGRLEGTDLSLSPAAAGSHIDTVVNGGSFDGALGVAAAALALSYLQKAYGPPKRTLIALSLCEEEGSRFPLAYWGSGSITGIRSWEADGQLADKDGITLLDAARRCGFGPDSLYRIPSMKLQSYVELHIEQGFVLEKMGQQAGVVSAIVGQHRYEIHLQGEANHAGTTPMRWRKDALAAASQMIAVTREAALLAGDPLVATVGSVSSAPGVSNVVAGSVTFTLDIRHPDDVVLQQFADELLRRFIHIADTEGIRLAAAERLRAAAVPMHGRIVRELEHICQKRGLESRMMPSGAGHDAQILSVICPTGMIFVPSRHGISHNPAEYTEPEALKGGFKILTDMLYQLGYGSVDL
ncbi:M20 family metallo-hydrolase [Paenibacillus sp. P96]|uniref:M20 family metallo-hydrolase n=1 Tax=Paenibacillus zeirhizosphaerae TaxID=2987519 RepID=A0ABT9FVT1_9BACL|nr:M20 family metallo-hydrolase [Paenibacillus sp. P96]MDP4098720.1 M20 family metallo-hydrolase [Paenibacillus sp. P96]